MNLRHKIKCAWLNFVRRIWRKIYPPICGHCNELIEGMVMGVSINYLDSTRYHYSCYKEKFNLPKCTHAK